MSGKTDLLERLAEWPVAATYDDRELFYDKGDVAKLESGGRKFVVVGRKGTGKSAICEHFAYKFPRQAIQLSTTDFPWPIFSRLEDQGYSRASGYLTAWTFIILRSLIQLLQRTDPQRAERVLQVQTVKRFFAELGVEPRQRLDELILSIVARGVTIGAIELGPEKDQSSTKPPSVYEFNLAARDVLRSVLPANQPYYILFDGLDDNFNPYSDELAQETYIRQVASLIDAAALVRRDFPDRNVLPIIFVRSDLLERMQKFNDQNKVEDVSIQLEWTPERLSNLVTFRLSKSLGLSEVDQDFGSVWTKAFFSKTIGGGRHNEYPRDMFGEFILSQTLHRPRDVIAYMSFCAREALDRNKHKVPVDAVRAAQHPYSTHFKREFENELSPTIPDISRALGVFGLVRKKAFSYAEIQGGLEKMDAQQDVELGSMTTMQFVKYLFGASVIGIHSGGGRFSFKYLSPQVQFDSTKTIGLHRGLHMEFNIRHS